MLEARRLDWLGFRLLTHMANDYLHTQSRGESGGGGGEGFRISDLQDPQQAILVPVAAITEMTVGQHTKAIKAGDQAARKRKNTGAKVAAPAQVGPCQPPISLAPKEVELSWRWLATKWEAGDGLAPEWEAGRGCKYRASGEGVLRLEVRRQGGAVCEQMICIPRPGRYLECLSGLDGLCVWVE